MYYVAGGMYLTEQKELRVFHIKEFDLVRPSGKQPCYITKNPNGLALTSHHASLYGIKETDDGYMLTRVRHDIYDSPANIFIKRNTDLHSYLSYSIVYAEANNKFYE